MKKNKDGVEFDAVGAILKAAKIDGNVASVNDETYYTANPNVTREDVEKVRRWNEDYVIAGAKAMNSLVKDMDTGADRLALQMGMGPHVTGNIAAIKKENDWEIVPSVTVDFEQDGVLKDCKDALRKTLNSL